MCIRDSLLSISFASCSFLKPAAKYHVLRLKPKQDLLLEIKKYLKENNIQAASVISSVGSLTKVSLRFANQKNYSTKKGFFEIVSLEGILSFPHGSHLHMSVSDEKGKTQGGHLGNQNIVYTTVELILLELPNRIFERERCPLSGHKELKCRAISL